VGVAVGDIVAVAAGVGESTGVSAAPISVDGKRRTNPQKLTKNNKHRFGHGRFIRTVPVTSLRVYLFSSAVSSLFKVRGSRSSSDRPGHVEIWFVQYGNAYDPTSALPFTSSGERFIFPRSSSKILRFATFSARLSATVDVSR
jgi:hypothetical protein